MKVREYVDQYIFGSKPVNTHVKRSTGLLRIKYNNTSFERSDIISNNNISIKT